MTEIKHPNYAKAKLRKALQNYLPQNRKAISMRLRQTLYAFKKSNKNHIIIPHLIPETALSMITHVVSSYSLSIQTHKENCKVIGLIILKPVVTKTEAHNPTLSRELYETIRSQNSSLIDPQINLTSLSKT